MLPETAAGRGLASQRGEERRAGKEGGGEAAAAAPAARRRRAAPADCLLVGSGIFGLSDEIRIQDVPVTNPNSQLSSAISIHSQEPCEWFGHDLQVLVVKLEQILH